MAMKGAPDAEKSIFTRTCAVSTYSVVFAIRRSRARGRIVIDHYTRRGEPYTSWLEYLYHEMEMYEKGINFKTVALSKYGPFSVSTVWLGLDHGVPGWNKAPLIFETMVFMHHPLHGRKSVHGFNARYSTIEDAFKGHEVTSEAVRDEWTYAVPGWPLLAIERKREER